MHEWPLLIFTLMMQASIGCVLVTLLCDYRVFAAPDSRFSVSMVKTPLIIAFLLGCFAAIASMFHLGNISHALYSILNISNSWMSREILCSAIYMGLLLLSIAILLFRQEMPIKLLVLTAIVGLIDVFAMSNLYISSLFTLWSAPITLAGFYSSTFLLGAVFAVLFLAPALKKQNRHVEAGKVLRLALAVIIVGLFASIVSFAALFPQLGQPVTLGITPKVLPENLFCLNIVRVIFIAIAVLLLGRVICKAKSTNCCLTGSLLLVTFCMITGELLGRYVFFSLGA